MDADFIRGIGNQDQDVARINEVWSNTDPDMREELVCFLECVDEDASSSFLRNCPFEWVEFIQLCCLAGLRGAVLQST